MNNLSLTGCVGRDAELKTVGANSTSVLNFSVAMSTGYGEHKKTIWVGCALWGVRAASLAPHITKGTWLAVWGEVDIRAYLDKDQNPGAELKLKVTDFSFVGSKADNAGGGAAQPYTPGASAAPKSSIPDDVPF